MKGLIVKPYWADKILDEGKDIEVRGSNTNVRGTIGLIKSKSKKVYGTTDLYDCIKLTEQNFEQWRNRHKLTISFSELLKIYPAPYGWFFKNTNKYKQPISYEHKQGCVIWVNI